MQKTVVILGARGRLGWAVAQAFAAAGWLVKAPVRAGRTPPAGAPASVQWLVVDVADTAALVRATGPAQVVVHAMNPARYTTQAWQAEHPGMMRAATDVAHALGALLLFPGNVYNYGAQMPARLDATTPQRPTTGKGRVRVQIEQQLAQAVKRQGLHAVVLRAGDFFGAPSGTWLDQLLGPRLARGRMAWPGPLDIPHAWAYLPDLAQAFVRVAQATPQPVHGALEELPFAGHTVCGQDWVNVLNALAQAQGWCDARGLRVGPVPWWLMRLVGPLVPIAASVTEMRYLWQVPHALDGQALMQRVGVLSQTPFALAVQASVQCAGWTPALQMPH